MDNKQSKKLEKVVEAIEKVPDEIKQLIFEMAQNMTDMDIIQSFNQTSLDFFTTTHKISIKLGKENDIKVLGYKLLYENALKMNIKLPIDQFTLSILEYAPQIYEQNEEKFLKMKIPDAELQAGNEFTLIRSNQFKNLWIVLDTNDKNDIKEKLILLTTYAHAYIYKTVIKKLTQI